MTTALKERDLKTEVLAILEGHKGWENAIKGKRIAEMLDYKYDRAIQQAIEDLIDEGHVIASSCSNNRLTGQKMGYYIPITWQQEHDYKHQLRSRAIGNFKRYRRFKIACANRIECAQKVRMF